jgi:hypothetical protein
MSSHVDFDPAELGDIPDVEEAAAVASPPPAAPRPALEVGPTRAVVRRGRAVALAGALGWLAAQLLALGVRADLGRVGALYVALHVGLPAILAAATLLAALWPAASGLGASVAVVGGLTAASIAAYALAAAALPEPYTFVDPYGLTFWQWAVDCFDVTLVMGAGPLVLVSLAARRSFAAGALVRSAAAGLACGLAGLAAMNLHCENVERAHMLAAHGLPALALAAAGALLVRRAARV